MDIKTVHKLSTQVPTLTRKLDLSKFEVRKPLLDTLIVDSSR